MWSSNPSMESAALSRVSALRIADQVLHELRQPLPRSVPQERRRAVSLSTHWLNLVLEELDYGVLLVSGSGQLLYTNHAARRTLDARFPLQVQGGQLRTRLDTDNGPLFEALGKAETEGRRCLLRLGEGSERTNVVVVPLNRNVEQAAVLLVLERLQLCADLAAQWFALRYGLTPTETEVLKLLSEGARPNKVAEEQGVAISTVRTQIQSIRAKSGAQSIGELLRQLAVLPPLMSALRMELA
ncbi:helix-turn-helix transcriptional regulator [Roseateles flavus]|uniref:LuxR C-terminal-related transcriptional regulator n=2 Tax=Roseateles TaxID=93681 RepID=A0ABV0GKB6_9BURK